MGVKGDGSRGRRRPARPGLDVVVGDARGRRLRMAGLSSWLRRVAPARARGRVEVALVSDGRVRSLNRTYRRRDYATDVLSFPANEQSAVGSRQSPVRSRRLAVPTHDAPRTGHHAPAISPWLGEIVIACGVARRQALSAGHSELTELRVLALHGLLHLLGYDHERDSGEMRRVEERLRRKGGLREGLIERTR